MAKTKLILRRESMKGHRFLGWTGGLALLVFAVSGLTHPIMTWMGPQAASFFPLRAILNAGQAEAIPEILAAHGIDRARLVKIVPAKGGPVLQVTMEKNDRRRYFDLAGGQELARYDELQARWLAAYYTGLDEKKVTTVSLQTEFDDAYPWVNRLLPVWKVEFDTPDNRVAYVYTELGALAALTNNTKNAQQFIFRNLHSFAWLEGLPAARIILMILLLLSLLGLCVTGINMIFLISERRIPDARRRWHRRLANGLWLPLFAFTASGIYHLLQNEIVPRQAGFRPPPAMEFSASAFGASLPALEKFSQTPLTSLTLVQGEEGRLFYRLGLPAGPPGQKVSRAEKFEGLPMEKPAWYIDAQSGEMSEKGDRDFAVQSAQRQFAEQSADVTGSSLVTSFGEGYDFRNKRLPVWKVDFDSPEGDSLYMDPSSGMIVDRSRRSDRIEGFSFSNFHKWNFLTPVTGREIRDVLIVTCLLVALGMGILGFVMLIRRRK